MGRRASLNDEQLTALLLSDDVRAFDELYNRYWSRLYVHALKRIQEEEAARELVQDVFTELWIYRQERKIHTSLAAYLYQAIRYKTLNHMQKQWIRERYSIEIQSQAADGHNATEESVFFEELYNRVDTLSSSLPPQCKKVFELSRKEYKNNREIAEELSISEKTVEFHLTKALRYLRIHLSDSLTFIVLSLIC